jgi:hypothetical protein
VLGEDRGEFLTSMKLMSRQDKFIWEVINVYGLVQLERKQQFLDELTQSVTGMSYPFIIGGDFNLIRFAWENPLRMPTNSGWISSMTY